MAHTLSTAQVKGRQEAFADYRLRVAGVLRDYGQGLLTGLSPWARPWD